MFVENINASFPGTAYGHNTGSQVTDPQAYNGNAWLTTQATGSINTLMTWGQYYSEIGTGGGARGVVAHDLSGYGNDGQIIGGVTLGVPGPLFSGATAMQFDGSSGLVAVPYGNLVPLQNKSCSMEIWALATNGSFGTLVSNTNNSFAFGLSSQNDDNAGFSYPGNKMDPLWISNPKWVASHGHDVRAIRYSTAICRRPLHWGIPRQFGKRPLSF